jgi:hypothetical protein
MIPGSRQRETIINTQPKFKPKVKKVEKVEKVETTPKLEKVEDIIFKDCRDDINIVEAFIEVDSKVVVEANKVNDVAINLEDNKETNLVKTDVCLDETSTNTIDIVDEGSKNGSLCDENYIYELKGNESTVSDSNSVVKKKRKRKKSTK